MKYEDMHVVADMSASAVQNGFTKTKIAETVHKDLSVVKKQLAERGGNILLSTAYSYAEAINGIIVYLDDAQYSEYLSIPEYKAKIQELETQISGLQAQLEDKQGSINKLFERIDNYKEEHDRQETQITNLSDTIKHQQALIDKLNERIDAKDEAISRKDKRIDALGKQFNLWS